MTGSSTQGINTVLHRVSDLAAAKAVYAAKLAEVTAAGASEKEPVRDVGGGRLVAGFDPRALATSYRWLRVSSRRIQAWREVNELPTAS